KQASCPLLTQLPGVGPRAAVGGHLIVLDTLGGGDQARVAHSRVGPLLNHLLALGEQPMHSFAGFAFGLRTELAEIEGSYSRSVAMATSACCAPGDNQHLDRSAATRSGAGE